MANATAWETEPRAGSIDPADASGVRRLRVLDGDRLRKALRATVSSCAVIARIRSIVAVIDVDGTLFMATWASPLVARLDVGLAEARTYRAFRHEEHVDHPCVRLLPLADAGSTFGLVRCETTQPPDPRVDAGLCALADALATALGGC